MPKNTTLIARNYGAVMAVSAGTRWDTLILLKTLAFVFRFNRRRTRHAAFRSLLGIAAGHPPLSYNMLISPEAKS